MKDGASSGEDVNARYIGEGKGETRDGGGMGGGMEEGWEKG